MLDRGSAHRWIGGNGLREKADGTAPQTPAPARRDRGWWLSVDFCPNASPRPSEGEVMDLMDRGEERYDMMTAGGGRICRSIFRRNTDPSALAELVRRVRAWDSAVICVNGRVLEPLATTRLLKVLACAGERALCRRGFAAERLAFLGCHMPRIGLGGYSLEAVKQGRTFWFAAFSRHQSVSRRFCLNRSMFDSAVELARLCPVFPDRLVRNVLERLPDRVDLNTVADCRFWTAAERRLRRRSVRRAMPVLPVSQAAYRRWFNERILDLVNLS